MTVLQIAQRASSLDTDQCMNNWYSNLINLNFMAANFFTKKVKLYCKQQVKEDGDLAKVTELGQQDRGLLQ